MPKLAVDDDLQAQFAHANRKSLVLMSIALMGFCGIVAYCKLVLRMTPQEIVTISTILFQLGIIGWGLGVVWNFMMKSTLMMNQSLRLGSKANESLATLQDELKPVITDLRDAVKDARTILHDVREEDLGKLHEVADRLTVELDGQGKFHRVTEALEKIADLTERGRWKTLMSESDDELTRMVARRIDAMLADDETEEGKPDGA